MQVIEKLQKRIAELQARVAAGPKPRVYKPKAKTEAQLAAAAEREARAAFKKSHGYRKPKAHAGTLLGYAYPFRKTNKKGKRVLAGLAIGKGLSRKHKPRFSLYRTGKGYTLFKNPAIGGVVVAGVPVIDMAIGSVATIAIGAISKKLITKFAPAVATSPVGDIAGELATAGVSALLYMKVLKNPMHKSIAQYAFIGAVFQILSKKLSPQIENLVGQIPGLGGHYGSTHGIYFDPYTSTPAVGGAYLPTTAGTDIGGMYTNVDGLGLFNAPSIYG